MPKEKGPASASEYIRYQRQLANLKLARADVSQGVPAAERKNIISNSPLTDSVSRSFMSRFARISITPPREFIRGWGTASIFFTPAPQAGFTATTNIAIMGDSIYVTENSTINTSSIRRVPLNGGTTSIVHTTNSTSDGQIVGVTSYNNALYFTVTSASKVRTATLSNNILDVRDYATSLPFGGVNDVRTLAFDSSGNLYAVIPIGNGNIVKIGPGGVNAAIWSNGVGGPLAFQGTCAIVNGIEYLYVAEPVGDAVFRIPLTSPNSPERIAGLTASLNANIGDNDVNLNPIGALLNDPRSVMVDSYGNVYIGSDWNGKHFVIDVETGLLSAIFRPGSFCRGFVIDERTKRGYFILGNGNIQSAPYFVDYKYSTNYM